MSFTIPRTVGPATSMRTFHVLFGGHLVSMLGSGLTRFALALWVYLDTRSVTVLTAVVLSGVVPGLISAPFAGALVDRWDRRLAMLAGNTVSALATLAVLALVTLGQPRLAYFCLLVGLNAVASSIQRPAYLAAVSTLVPKASLARANGLTQLGQAVATVAVPVLAGLLLQVIGIAGVLLIDLGTFGVAATTLLLVRVPRPSASRDPEAARTRLIEEVLAGWTYLRQRAGLMGLLVVFTAVSLLLAFTNVLSLPLLLSFSTPSAMGVALSLSATGLIAGGALVLVRGVPQRKVRGLLGFLGLGGLVMAVVGLRPSLAWVACSLFCGMFLTPIAAAADDVLWQTKVAHGFQGRVFAFRRLMTSAAAPLAYLAAGPLADRVFEPLMAAGGPLASSLGRILGVGPGRGIGLMFVLLGLCVALLAIGAYCQPRIRFLEGELPDAAEAHIGALPALGSEP